MPFKQQHGTSGLDCGSSHLFPQVSLQLLQCLLQLNLRSLISDGIALVLLQFRLRGCQLLFQMNNRELTAFVLLGEQLLLLIFCCIELVSKPVQRTSCQPR